MESIEHWLLDRDPLVVPLCLNITYSSFCFWLSWHQRHTFQEFHVICMKLQMNTLKVSVRWKLHPEHRPSSVAYFVVYTSHFYYILVSFLLTLSVLLCFRHFLTLYTVFYGPISVSSLILWNICYSFVYTFGDAFHGSYWDNYCAALGTIFLTHFFVIIAVLCP